jgi:hypothetical protein
MRIAFRCASDPGKRRQLASLWCCWQQVDPQRCRNLSSEWRHKALDQATKVPLLLVPDVGVQPRYAPPHQIGRQGNSFDGNPFEKTADRRERVTGADCHKDMIAFTHVQLRPHRCRRRADSSWRGVSSGACRHTGRPGAAHRRSDRTMRYCSQHRVSLGACTRRSKLPRRPRRHTT